MRDVHLFDMGKIFGALVDDQKDATPIEEVLVQEDMKPLYEGYKS